jgi:hypothetical protein
VRLVILFFILYPNKKLNALGFQNLLRSNKPNLFTLLKELFDLASTDIYFTFAVIWRSRRQKNIGKVSS